MTTYKTMSLSYSVAEDSDSPTSNTLFFTRRDRPERLRLTLEDGTYTLYNGSEIVKVWQDSGTKPWGQDGRLYLNTQGYEGVWSMS